MDIEKLCIALQCSLSHVQSERLEAETYLKQCQSQEGFPSFILHLLFSSPEGVQLTEHNLQSGTILLKNLVKNCWNLEEDQKRNMAPADIWTMHPSDKKFMLENIFPYLCRSPSKNLACQLEEMIEIIGDWEFPGNWGCIIPQIIEALGMEDDVVMYAGLCATYRLTKLYKLELGNDRSPLDIIVTSIFPALLDLLTRMRSVEMTEQSATMMKEITKCFLAVLWMGLPQALTEPTIIDAWITQFHNILELPLPEELLSLTEDEAIIQQRKKSKFWQLKKISLEILYRLFQKYGNPKFWKKGEYVLFSRLINSQYILAIVERAVSLLKASVDIYIDPTTLMYAIKTITQSIKNESTFPLIKPLLLEILEEYIFPKLFISQADAMHWDESPEEFTRQQFDITDIFTLPRTASLDFINIACGQQMIECTNTMHPILHPFMDWIAATFKTAANSPNPDPRIFDALMTTIISIGEYIWKYDNLLKMTENIIFIYVIPQFQHSIGFLRMRACQLYSEFANYEFENTELMLGGVQELYTLLQDPDLPVRIVAATSIHRFLDHKQVQEGLKPLVSELLTTYLKLMSQLEIEELVEGLQCIVKTYEKDIEPFAIELTGQLVGAFQKAETQGEQSSESALAAHACLETISRIVYSIGNTPALSQIQDLITPIIEYAFTPKGEELTEICCIILAQLTYFSPTITIDLWNFYPIIIEYLVGSPRDVEKPQILKEGGPGFEFLKLLSVSLQNYIAKNGEYFYRGRCGKGNYLDLMFGLISRIIEIARFRQQELDAIMGMKLLVTMVEALPGKLDDVFQNIIGVIVQELRLAITENYKSMLVQAISMTLYYNPEATFSILEKGNHTEQVFKELFIMIPKFKWDFEFKRAIFGLTTILVSPPQIIPLVLHSGMVYIFEHCINMGMKAIEKKEKGEVEDLEDVEVEGGEDETESEDEEWEDEEFKVEGTDIELNISPLDNVDELMFFHQHITNLMNTNKEQYNSIIMDLDSSYKTKLGQVMGKAVEIFQKPKATNKH